MTCTSTTESVLFSVARVLSVAARLKMPKTMMSRDDDGGDDEADPEAAAEAVLPGGGAGGLGKTIAIELLGGVFAVLRSVGSAACEVCLRLFAFCFQVSHFCILRNDLNWLG